jgi:hypothetical protein
VIVLGICLALSQSVGDILGGSPNGARFIAAERFTLAWTHSIEKVRWEEDYAVLPRSEADGAGFILEAISARVRGSAAGMEPGPEAVLENGWFRYVPMQRFHDHLQLTRSIYTADYELCIDGTCRAMSEYLRSDGWMTHLFPCRSSKAGH